MISITMIWGKKTWVLGSWDWIIVVVAVLAVSVFCRYQVIGRNKVNDDYEEEEEEGKNRIPRGSSGWPLLGETLDFIASGYSSRPVRFMEKRVALYGKVFRTHILGKAIIVSTDPDVNKVVLQNHGNAFVPHYPKSIAELLGKYSILHINGPLQKRLHALLGGFLRSPQFKAQITRDIRATVQRTLSSCIHAQEEHQPRIYVQDEAKKIAFEIMVRTLMSIGPGEDLNWFRKEFEEYGKGLISLPVKFPGTRLYKSLKAKERMLKVIRRIIEQRKLCMSMEENNNAVRDTIDVLLRDSLEDDETQPRLPLDSISENIIEMMIPGEETVPTALTLVVQYLSHSPTALTHIVEENMELKRQKLQTNVEYDWSDYVSLPFTQNVISETLRMGNIVNAVWREAVKDVKIKGHLIPKGWCVLASFSSLHMDEANYETPYEFNPHRWEKTGANVNSNKFTPFGGGQRLCPGLELSRLEIAIFLHHLVTTYRWVADDDDITYFPFVRLRRKLPITITPL